MKRILVPTDFSETANKARDYAVQFAKESNDEVILLNTHHVSYAGVRVGTTVDMDKIAYEASEQLMNEQLEYLNLNYANIKFRPLFTSGLLVDSIRRICNIVNIDLVVMGTTGTSGFIENTLGSNTSSLVGLIKTPIIAVPLNATINFPKNILVVNDLMISGDEKLFLPLKEMATKKKSTLDFLFVVDDEQKIDHKIQRIKASNFDDKFNIQFHPLYCRNGASVEDEIFDYINNHDVDLLTVVSHQRSFWQNLFHNSLAKSITKHSKLPILILSE